MRFAFKPIVKITSNVILGGYRITSLASSAKARREMNWNYCALQYKSKGCYF
jgi:hypothetical protein